MLLLASSVGLFGLIRLSLLEYRNELGLMRAVGGSNRHLFGVILFEGMGFGLLTWTIALPISFVSGRWLSSQIGQLLFSNPLSYRFSILGSLLCALGVVVLAILGSLAPSRAGAKTSLQKIINQIR